MRVFTWPPAYVLYLFQKISNKLEIKCINDYYEQERTSNQLSNDKNLINWKLNVLMTFRN